MTLASFPQKYKPRVPVPAEVRLRLASLTAAEAMRLLHISRETYDDACAVNGLLRTEVLERIRRRLSDD